MPTTSTRRLAGAVLVFLGVMGIAIALSAVLTSLPAPAAGGTCGPGTSSESAAAAFFDPVSIGAGPPPPASAGTAAHLDWLAFIGECQSAANSRMLVGLFTLALALGAGVGGLVLLRRSGRAAPRAVQAVPAAAPPGWYPDPAGTPSGFRWWDGRAWGPERPASTSPTG